MSTGSHAIDVQKHVRWYIRVFAALMVLTVLTVGVSYLELRVHLAVTVALLIATIKGSLVACYFMHLISERKFIYTVLAVTVAFFLAMLFGPVMTYINSPGA